MKASNPFYKEKLGDRIPDDLGREIDIFETEIDLRKQDRVDEKIFAETRLRRGVYGQRYDNGQRHDGEATRPLNFPCGELTKGPNTVWDAPGMMRIKIPFGGMTAEQLEVMADLAEEYSDGIGHVTTRQDFQLHFIHIEDTPALMRRLAAVGITTREACGNSVRNVTACPIAGVCKTEVFDVTPYAKALTYFLLGHHDVQDFGRKFKIAFSGCHSEGCGLTNIHDLGLTAATRTEGGKEIRGFKVWVGGGLGAVPYPAKVLHEFLPVEELLPMSQAVSRVFSRLGEKKNRARARIKFLVASLGIDEFKRLVQEERAALPHDERWTEYLKDIDNYYNEAPLKAAGELNGHRPEGFEGFQRTNIYPQKQSGYSTVTIKLPLGDLTATQLRAVADMARTYVKDTVRTTVEQNLVLRWVSDSDLPALYEDLKRVQLAESGAEGITDVVACPGTDTCKLGISASRGLAGEIRREFQTGELEIDETIERLRIKISGCFNSCGQHHISDLGFYGVSRKVGGSTVPHFQVVLGGQWTENGGAYGLPIIAIPSKRVPEVIRRIGKRYAEERQDAESFQSFAKRLGKVEVKKMLQDLTQVPSLDEDRSVYMDWGDARIYTTGDMGVGECAGEVVSRADMDLAASERLLFEAQVEFDQKNYQKAGEMAYRVMTGAARALIKIGYLDIPDDPKKIVPEFQKRLVDTGRFADPYAGNKFAQYLIDAHARMPENFTEETARYRLEEASLFVEASYSAYTRISDQLAQIVAAGQK